MEHGNPLGIIVIICGLVTLVFIAFGIGANNQDNQTPITQKWDGMAEIVTYNGHEYIRFDGGNATWGCHNPDCKCMKKEVQNARNQD